jgi:hypothetical protein
MIVAGIAMGATLPPFLLTRQKPEAKAANRIREQYLAEKSWILQRGDNATWHDLDAFLGWLKSIDTGKAPQDIQSAMTRSKRECPTLRRGHERG